MAIHLRQLTLADVDAVEPVLSAAYSRPEGWREEVALFLSVAPAGWIAAELEGRIVGMGGATDYGPFGWIGLMAVDPTAQRRGIGRLILAHVLDWLRERGCPIAVLDASAAGEPLYRSSGFADHGSTVLLVRDGGVPVHAPSSRVAPLQPFDLTELADFDTPIFGANRGRLLAALLAEPGASGLAARDEQGNLTGYVVVQPDRIGPWLAITPEVAEELLAAALAAAPSRRLTVRAPSLNRNAQPLLQRHGFAIQRSLCHMYLGPSPPPQDRTLIYSESSFAVG